MWKSIGLFVKHLEKVSIIIDIIIIMRITERSVRDALHGVGISFTGGHKTDRTVVRRIWVFAPSSIGPHEATMLFQISFWRDQLISSRWLVFNLKFRYNQRT